MKNTNIIGIIPARMASTRFPGKPLAKIQGIPMIGHIYFRSKMSNFLDGVYLATPDKKISDYIESIKGLAIMTKSSHRSAPDRTAEALLKIERKIKKKINIVVMVQGDEPMIKPEMFAAVLKPLIKDKSIQISNLAVPITDIKEYNDPNVVKVVTDKNNFALYFSREPIPSLKKGAMKAPMLKQTGIIAFRRNFLIKFNKMKPTPLELVESIDMLRLLENRLKVKIAPFKGSLYSVDTKRDLGFVKNKMINDKLVKSCL